MTYTVSEPDHHEVWTAQQVRGRSPVEHADGLLTVTTPVDGGGRGDAEVMGVSVPTSSIHHLEVLLEYSTESTDPEENALIDERGYGHLLSARFTVGFRVDRHGCELVLDLLEPGDAAERAIWRLVHALLTERHRSGAVTGPRLKDGKLVRRPILEPPPVEALDHPATPPRHWRCTLDLDLPAATAVDIGDPSKGSLDTSGLAEKLWGD